MLIATADRRMAIQLTNDAVQAGARKTQACTLPGLSVRTLQRWQQAGGIDRRTLRRFVPANKLSEAERQQVVATANRADNVASPPNKSCQHSQIADTIWHLNPAFTGFCANRA